MSIDGQVQQGFVRYALCRVEDRLVSAYVEVIVVLDAEFTQGESDV
jgi:hypothetical protein